MTSLKLQSRLTKERHTSAVQSGKLACILYGGQDRLAALRRIWHRVENDPAFDKEIRPTLNHSDRYIDACKKIKRFQEIVDDEGLKSLDEFYNAYLAIDESVPLDVHLSMFIPIMSMHTSPNQKKRWLSAAKSFRIIGAYAQTELAHGSNVRGIETTATFDRDTDEFVIHSPTLTSTKWWPGGLAHTATHAVVYANLIIGEKNYGPHPFMVQLRSLRNHTRLPGVMTGDIGPKMGYNSMDNGYAVFNNVRIPREDMLMGFAQVSPSGGYTKQDGAEKVAYGIMLDVRARICANSAYVLARALTISIRYSCVRTQGFLREGSSRSANNKRRGTDNESGGESVEYASPSDVLIERPVMDYPTQQRVLMPLLALCFSVHFTGVSLKDQYRHYTRSGDLSLLPELHASSACLKAYITLFVSDGVEACRKVCGGHGFLANAGFADLHTSYLAFCTVEGTKEVLQQQTGRFLLKCFSSAMKKLEMEKRSFLSRRPQGATASQSGRTSVDYLSSYLLEMYADRVSKVKKTEEGLERLVKAAKGGFKHMSASDFQFIEDLLLKAFKTRAAWCVAMSARAVSAASKKQSVDPASVKTEMGDAETVSVDPLVVASVELCDAAEAHTELLLLSYFADGIHEIIRKCKPTMPTVTERPNGSSSATATESSTAIKDGDHLGNGLLPDGPEIIALKTLFTLQAVSCMRRSAGQFIAAKVIAGDDVAALRRVEGLLCAALRVDAVNLIESWQFSDKLLDSTIGKSDGNVYEALLEAANKEPLNSKDVSDGYTKYLRHVINREPSFPVDELGRLIDPQRKPMRSKL